jgi:hypothetical protein
MPTGESDRCLGSRTFVEFDPGQFCTLLAGVAGVCPVCGGRFELGYAGLLPDHIPPIGGRPASCQTGSRP